MGKNVLCSVQVISNSHHEMISYELRFAVPLPSPWPDVAKNALSCYRYFKYVGLPRDSVGDHLLQDTDL